MTEKKILIVESETRLYRFIADDFASRGAAHEIVSAGSVSQALDIIDDGQIDIAVCHHEGPDGIDGLQLLPSAAKTLRPVRFVLCTEPPLEHDSVRAIAWGCDAFLVNPPLDKLTELVFEMLQPDRGFSGRLVGVRIEDVIEMLCLRKDSSLLTVYFGDSMGAICIHEGEIVHAQCDTLRGVEAVFEIIGWDGGEFCTQSVLEVPEQTVFMDWQSVLMEGMRQRDEIRHALGSDPSSSGRPYVKPAAGERSTPGDRIAAVAAPAQVKRVMIVDDSRFIRKIVQEILRSDPRLEVAGLATNGRDALSKLDQLHPDLILLDWDMPVMMGGTALMHIMIKSACPVVILSGYVKGAGSSSFDLLCLGAVDFLRKPQSKWLTDGRAEDLLRRIWQACNINPQRIRRIRIPDRIEDKAEPPENGSPSTRLTVLVSSTGGCADLIRILPRVRADVPSAFVAIHDMQPDALSAFIEYLDERSLINVRPAESGIIPRQGVCYIHPMTAPLQLATLGGNPVLQVLAERPGTGVVDRFLESAARVMGKDLTAILLSGGPDQGVEGFRAVRKAHGATAVQDPNSCVDPRMAEAVLGADLVDHTWSAALLAESFRELIG